MFVYIASFNNGHTDGLWQYELDERRGELGLTASYRDGVRRPLYLTTDQRQRWLFVADHDDSGGAVCAYAIHPVSGALTFLNRQSSMGTVPCYLSVTADGRFVLVANWGNGSIAVLPVDEDGRLGEAVSVYEGGRAHCIALEPGESTAVGTDIGRDEFLRFWFDGTTGALTLADRLAMPAGAGPRHLAFGTGNTWLINEHANTIISLADRQTVSTLPAGWAGKNHAADLHWHPNGRFLYASNRGHDSLAGYARDAVSGQLELLGHTPTQGKFPRAFVIDPSGTWLLVGNEKSDSIVSFRIEEATGALQPIGPVATVPAPVCLCCVTPGRR